MTGLAAIAPFDPIHVRAAPWHPGPCTHQHKVISVPAVVGSASCISRGRGADSPPQTHAARAMSPSWRIAAWATPRPKTPSTTSACSAMAPAAPVVYMRPTDDPWWGVRIGWHAELTGAAHSTVPAARAAPIANLEGILKSETCPTGYKPVTGLAGEHTIYNFPAALFGGSCASASLGFDCALGLWCSDAFRVRPCGHRSGSLCHGWAKATGLPCAPRPARRVRTPLTSATEPAVNLTCRTAASCILRWRRCYVAGSQGTAGITELTVITESVSG